MSGPRLGYYARLVGAQLRMSVLAALQYRVGFWTDGVLGLFWSALGIAPLLVAAQHLGAVKGWGTGELVVLTGCFSALSGVFGALLQPALSETMSHIRRGTLDYVLMRPADSLALCLTAAFRPWSLLDVAGGLGLVGAGLWIAGRTPSAEQVAAALVTGAAGVTALYAFGVMVLCVSFRAIQIHALVFLMEALLDFGRWPAQVFPPALRVFFTFVVPLLVMTSYPAEALLGRLAWSHVAMTAAISASLMALARLWWRASVRSYTSASS